MGLFELPRAISLGQRIRVDQPAEVTARDDLVRAAQRRRLADLGATIGAVANSRCSLVAAAGIWFLLVFLAILWSQRGVDPRLFSSPDEAVGRHAAELVAAHGKPFDRLSQSDPEDLLHERLWITIGDHAIPAYPPTAYYLQGGLLKVPGIGILLVPALPAIAVAAFVLAFGILFPPRRFLAPLAPLLAFPALYWLLRPWTNMSTFLAFLCIAFCLWAAWLRSRSPAAVTGGAVALALAAAIRPDYAAFVLALALAACLAEARPQERKGLVVAVASAGAVAVAINLALNYATTGNPIGTAYAIWDDRNGIARPGGSLPVPFSDLALILLPYGVPNPAFAFEQFQRYWLHLGPIWVIVAGQLALLPLLARQPKRRVVGYAALVVIAIVFMFTHLSPDIFGADQDNALLRHSATRYWSPVYLLAAAPPLIFVMQSKREWIGVGLMVAVAVLGGRTVFRGQPESLESMRNLYAQRQLQVSQWQADVPASAVVFTVNLDKITWSHWNTAILPNSDDQAATAQEMDRSIENGRAVYVIQLALPDDLRSQLSEALRAHALALVSRDADGTVSEVVPTSPDLAAPSQARGLPQH